MPTDVESVCVTQVHEVSVLQALAMELVNTMILMLAVAGASDPTNRQNKNTLNLRVALVVTVLIITMDPYTHAGKNPARSLSPAILFNQWQDQWLYQVGPFCGATLGALIYRFIFDVRNKYSLHSKLLTLFPQRQT